MRTYNTKAAEVLSTLLGGPGARWCKQLNAKEREGCILDSGKDGEKVVERMTAAIKRRSNANGKMPSFSLAIDATKVVSVLEASSQYKCILGGAHPAHMIDIANMTKGEVRQILDGKSKEHGKVELATEIKVCSYCVLLFLLWRPLANMLYVISSFIFKVTVMSFQGTPSGISPMEIVAARPQSNNESNDFIKDMELAASAAARSSGAGAMSFTNYCVDGVSCESAHVWFTTCEFMSCKSNHLGSTDNNHNIKSWRYQIIGGPGTQGCVIGRYMIDSFVLRANVSSDIWRPNDFASDRLVLQLVSYETIKSLSKIEPLYESTSKGDTGVLGLTLFFMRLHLYAVNGKGMKASHRAVYLYCSMLWLTSISGASVITKRNIMSETIAFMFLVLRSDIAKSRHCTSEPAEHTFGNLRLMCREFGVLEFCQMIDKLILRVKLAYKHGFRPSKEIGKGYQATYEDFFDYTYDSNVDEGMLCLCIIF